MNTIAAIDPTNSRDPTDASDDTNVEEAFQQGIVHFMLAMLQGAQNDIVTAINDTTSEPGAAG